MNDSGRISGFTLIEVIVALAITAIMGVMVYGGLRAVLDNRDNVELMTERLRDLQYAMRVMSQDIYQITPRPVRDELGDNKQPALVGDLRGTYLIELTRAGWPNPAGLPRSSQQRVGYRFEEDTLIRDHWRVLDRTLSNPPVEFAILDGVEDVAFRYMTSNRQWADSWPADNTVGDPVLDARPLAVEIRIVLEDWGEMTRVIEVSR